MLKYFYCDGCDTRKEWNANYAGTATDLQTYAISPRCKECWN